MDFTDAFVNSLQPMYFASFEELKLRMKEFEESSGLQYSIKRSATGCLLVKRNSIRYPPESPEHRTLVYKSLTYACCHYGNGRVRSVKLQPPKTRKMNCPCEIRIGCRAKKLHIIAFVMRHNHPVAAELAENYPENRRLTEKEKDEINDILKSSPSNSAVKEHIERKFGKHCSLNDVRQMKYRFRKTQKLRSVRNFPSAKLECETPEDDDINHAYELPAETISNWTEQTKENKLSQFVPYSQKLAELLCSSDNETFYERLDFIKELVETWQAGKQPVLLTL
ncbi:hypothetical protein SprV_0100441300 [Sparganum proliferum]